MLCDPVMTCATPGPGHGSQPRRGDPVTWGVVTRERSRGKSVYNAQWRKLVAETIAAGARCVDCGTSRNLEGDHELPASRGGLSTRANLAIRCRRHNRVKGNRVTRYQLRVPWPPTPPAPPPTALVPR